MTNYLVYERVNNKVGLKRGLFNKNIELRVLYFIEQHFILKL